LFGRAARALRSLRWRLTLTFAALLAVLLAALGTYQYVTLRQSLIDNRVAALQDDYDSARVIVSRVTRAGPVIRGRVFCNLDPQLAGRVVASTVSQVSGHTVSVVVYGSKLLVAAQAPASADVPRLDSSTLQQVLTGTRSSPQVVNGANGDQLVVGFPVSTSAGRVCGIAQLSTAMSPINAVLGEDVALLTAGSGIALAVALVIGLLFTGRALRPLRRLTHTAEELAAGDLRARTRLVPRADEVGALTESFDHMADRIEESFARQQESEAQVRRFIADASHELRTPLTSLKGYIDVLRRGAARDPEALDAALDVMGREADRMRLLVLDLLTLARIDARREPASEVFEMNAEVSRLLDEGVPGMPPTVERQIAAGPLTVRADREALATMVRNVMVNACKYAPGAAQRWTTSVDGGRARIDAHDDGPGIPAADLPHVFERFYRGEKTRAREEGGSGLGLGLAIVQGLARSLGGETAVSSGDGAGTTVTMWLPLAAAPSVIRD